MSYDQNFEEKKSFLSKGFSRPMSETKLKADEQKKEVVMMTDRSHHEEINENHLCAFSSPRNSFSKEQKTCDNEQSVFRRKIEDYIIGKEIGKGAYAVVKQAIHRPTGKKLALKIYDKYKLMDASRKKAVKREIQVMKQLDHPNVVKLIEVIDGKKQIFLVMEMVSGVSLLSFLKAMPHKKIEELTCKNIFLQIIRGINYLHSKHIFHRDLKLENIIIDDKNNIKIIDFGFGTQSADNQMLSFFCGTPSYMPPEIVQKKDYLGRSADIWSLGILLYALLCGAFPFRGVSEKELYVKITKGNFSIPDYVSAEAKSLLNQILIVNPCSRLNSENILSHEWLLNDEVFRCT